MEKELQELISEKKLEKEIATDMWNAYHPTSESIERQNKILKLKKDLNILESEQNRINPAIIEAKKRKLRGAVLKNIAEKQLSNQIINMHTQSDTVKLLGGKLKIGY